MEPNNSIVSLKINILPGAEEIFSKWQARLRGQISQAKGFISLEILTPTLTSETTWTLNFRFSDREHLNLWLQSLGYEKLVKELTKEQIIQGSHAIFKETPNEEPKGITEVYVTFVDKTKVAPFQKWHEKIHNMESRFPGFQKVYVQAPDNKEKEGAWITLLQFDTAAHLENWLNSPERAEILKESQEFILSRETHRLLATFGGWFSDKSLIKTPPKWKQVMLVVLALFPVVMLQYYFLTPHLMFLNGSFRSFVQSIINVGFLTWPLLPIAIYGLKWWLESETSARNLMGLLLVLALYALEIFIFW